MFKGTPSTRNNWLSHLEAVIAFSIAMVFTSVPLVLVLTGKIFGADWWNGMTAFGTVGAVLVAIIIPFWQYHKELIDLRISQLNADLVVVEEVGRLVFRVFDIRLSYDQDYINLPLDVLISLRNQLVSEKAKVTDRYGRSLMEELLQHIEILINFLNARDDVIGPKSNIRNYSFKPDYWLKEMSSIFERIRRLSEHVGHWRELILVELQALGSNPHRNSYSIKMDF